MYATGGAQWVKTDANFVAQCYAASLSIQCPSTVDVLFNTTGTVIVNSTGSLLSKVIANSSLANLTSNNSTSTDGLVNLSTTWNTSRDLAFNSTNYIEWTAMYTFKKCSTSIHYPNFNQNCEKARKPVTCTTKINIYGKNFLMLDILLILAIGVIILRCLLEQTISVI